VNTAQPKRGTVKDTPSSFAEFVLGTPVYDWQAKILHLIERGSTMNRLKVAVTAPNGAGKSERCVAISILRWLYRRGKVIVTSADSRQIDLQLMPAINKHWSVFARWKWEFLARSIRTEAGGFFNAFTTDEPGRAEGHHSGPDAPLLIIVDEAKSVDEGIYEAIDRCSFSTLLLISSPGLKMGRFYNAFTSHRAEWITFQIGLKDCPHVSQERISDVIAQYGPDHPLTRSTLYGEFMDEEEGTSFAVSLKDLVAVLDTPPRARLDPHNRCAFIDFAFGGNDENVIAIRNGNKLESLICWRDPDCTSTMGRCIVELSRAGLRPSQVWGDEGGGGKVICDLLASANWPIGRFNFGAKAANDFAFTSRGAEAWTGFGRMVTTGEVVLIRDETLIAQLTSRKTEFDMRGRTGLEKKEDMRARGLKSPDRADAVVGAFAMGGGYTNSNNRHARRAPSDDPWGELERYCDAIPSDNYEEKSDWARAGLSDPGG
jgi:phage terminase large subunit